MASKEVNAKLAALRLRFQQRLPAEYDSLTDLWERWVQLGQEAERQPLLRQIHTLKGNSGADLLKGGSGSDKLVGGSGDDRLKGGSGDDVIKGGSGDDTLWGGSGSDRFVFNGGTDVIRDFQDDADSIVVTRAMVNGAGSTVDDLLSMGEIVNGNAVFDLAGSHQLTVRGVDDLEDLRNDLIIS